MVLNFLWYTLQYFRYCLSSIRCQVLFVYQVLFVFLYFRFCLSDNRNPLAIFCCSSFPALSIIKAYSVIFIIVNEFLLQFLFNYFTNGFCSSISYCNYLYILVTSNSQEILPEVKDGVVIKPIRIWDPEVRFKHLLKLISYFCLLVYFNICLSPPPLHSPISLSRSLPSLSCTHLPFSPPSFSPSPISSISPFP